MDRILLDLAHARGVELRHDAARARLVRLATCCRPATWRRWAGALDARVRRSRVCCV
jgi:hypothetical protein